MKLQKKRTGLSHRLRTSKKRVRHHADNLGARIRRRLHIKNPLRRWQKILLVIGILLLAWLVSAYGISRWYMAQHADEPLEVGASFIPDYARYYELDPKETMQAAIDDLGIRRFRLVSYWEVHEPTPGKYDFSELDWQFKKAEAAGAKVSLSVGLRQPRWPECHMPEWALNQPKSQWYPSLKKYMAAVVNRYKDSPALLEYQLENEFHFTIFTRCVDNDPARLQEEYALIKALDPVHPIQMSISGDLNQAIGSPTPEKYGIALYKRLYEARFVKTYIEYPFPAWFYGYRAGVQRLIKHRDSFIHELQMEPWGPTQIRNMSIEEQNKSMDAKRVKSRLEFAKNTGMRTFDAWGIEWWYWRKEKLNDPSLWEAGKEGIQQLHDLNKSLLQ